MFKSLYELRRYVAAYMCDQINQGGILSYDLMDEYYTFLTNGTTLPKVTEDLPVEPLELKKFCMDNLSKVRAYNFKTFNGAVTVESVTTLYDWIISVIL